MFDQNDLDPRAQRTRVAMMRAIQQLIIDEGILAVTHQRVAEVAQVSRATVYRHWPGRSELILSVLGLTTLPDQLLAVGPIDERIRSVLRWAADMFSHPTHRAFILTITSFALHDADAARIRDARLNEAAQWFRQGIQDASIDTHGLSALEIVSMLAGPIWLRAIVQGQPVSDAFIDVIVSGFLDHFATTPEDHT